jgi:hypothetical protein
MNILYEAIYRCQINRSIAFPSGGIVPGIYKNTQG